MFKALIALVVIFFIATFPATWLLMLFLGNIGVNLSYWGTLPLGILVSVLLSAAITPSTVTTIINDWRDPDRSPVRSTSQEVEHLAVGRLAEVVVPFADGGGSGRVSPGIRHRRSSRAGRQCRQPRPAPPANTARRVRGRRGSPPLP